jgi:hypothetical protein
MGWIKNIKDSIGNYLLKGIAIKKKRSARIMPSYSSIQEIGIVYDAGTTKQEEQVNLLAEHLRKEGKKVFTLGFIDAKKLPENHRFNMSAGYYWRETLTKYNLPDKQKLSSFLNTEFDLLMNLFFEKELPLQAIAALSKSKFSMGANINGALPYNDFLIDTGTEKEITNLGMQMIHYLKVIQTK